MITAIAFFMANVNLFIRFFGSLSLVKYPAGSFWQAKMDIIIIKGNSNFFIKAFL